jgi:hypothetical protein
VALFACCSLWCTARLYDPVMHSTEESPLRPLPYINYLTILIFYSQLHNVHDAGSHAAQRVHMFESCQRLDAAPRSFVFLYVML